MASKVVIRSGRSARLCVLLLLVVLASTTAAYARTGAIANPRSVIFFYGEAAGSDEHSQNFAGYGNVTMCMNSEGGPNSTYVGKYKWYRPFGQPDVLLKERFQLYSQGQYQSADFGTFEERDYYTRVTWAAVPVLRNDIKGYVASRVGGLSCVWPQI